MFTLAVSLGIYSYLILALGLLGWLYRLSVFLVTIPFLVSCAFWLKRNLHFNRLKWTREIRKDRLLIILLGILIAQFIINFAGAISPELSFDALWYHLTLAKIYVENHRIFHIPGGLLYYSSIPRLIEMLYTSALILNNEILAKLIHFSFGILSAIALFNILKRYFSLRLASLGVVSFYTMLIIGWQSTTAYVDLGRTFFEILALDYFLRWLEEKKDVHLWKSAILTGLAISSKILAFGSLFTFAILIILLRRQNWFKQTSKFVLLTILVVSPWLLLSWRNTGNPLYPLGGSLVDPTVFKQSLQFSWLTQRFIKLPLLLWEMTIHPREIISPIYLLFLPLVLISIWLQKLPIKIVGLYFLLGAFFTPGRLNRYLLPYLTGFTLTTLSVFNYQWGKRKLMEKILTGLILFSALLSLGSRGLATRKFLPYILGRQTKAEFLSERLNFDFGDFYDVDGFFARNIKEDDLVLIYNIHNLYYVDFPFVHESWASPGTYFTHILVKDMDLPEKFGIRKLLYENEKTKVKLYQYKEFYQ